MVPVDVKPHENASNWGEEVEQVELGVQCGASLSMEHSSFREESSQSQDSRFQETACSQGFQQTARSSDDPELRALLQGRRMSAQAAVLSLVSMTWICSSRITTLL